jgi:hypothetical protein
MDVLRPHSAQRGETRLPGSIRAGLFAIVLACLFLLLPQTPLRAQTSEYDLKAVFLYNFTRFVTWPEQAFSSPSAPLQICVLGKDPFGRTLDEVIKNETVDQHPLAVNRIQAIGESVNCHILYMEGDDPGLVARALEQLSGKPVLTVSSEPGFLQKGGMIEFHLVNGHLQIKVNLDAAQASQLSISSKLLRVAEEVKGQ